MTDRLIRITTALAVVAVAVVAASAAWSLGADGEHVEDEGLVALRGLVNECPDEPGAGAAP